LDILKDIETAYQTNMIKFKEITIGDTVIAVKVPEMASNYYEVVHLGSEAIKLNYFIKADKE
jgi:hypothetical protein